MEIFLSIVHFTSFNAGYSKIWKQIPRSMATVFFHFKVAYYLWMDTEFNATKKIRIM